jgi:hypothetical protein
VIGMQEDDPIRVAVSGVAVLPRDFSLSLHGPCSKDDRTAGDGQ